MNSRNVAIKVENVSKCYRIGLKEEMHDSLVASFLNFVKSPLRNYRKYRSLYTFDDVSSDVEFSANINGSDLFWALRNVFFSVEKGEVVGIVGKNGAGKSTMLKILSKIAFPTRGHIEVHGKSSSLLEVGTGFHPELTGRENVYLNGTVLGMKKKEIDRKFDEIVDFSGVEKFLDTPVKRYSSGMNVRLAFAVAAHLEPQILIVDEVLAVGDAEFQAKCLGKMSTVAKQGRTVLFVSHNMGAITQLCSRALWVDGGCVKDDGLPFDIVNKYLSSEVRGEGAFWAGPSEMEREGLGAWLRQARIVSGEDNEECSLMHFNQKIHVEIEYQVEHGLKEFQVYLFLRDSFGSVVWAAHDTDGEGPATENAMKEPGLYQSICEFPQGLLNPGQYFISLGIFGKPQDTVHREYFDILNFTISESGYPFSFRRLGMFSPHQVCVWQRQRL
ncbi:MAG: ABC transporter ATP-binding protein [Nitrospirales bacterium]|nr:MAG: ABC transporter ATP-binding protein [Nitrospirales bacterium]